MSCLMIDVRHAPVQLKQQPTLDNCSLPMPHLTHTRYVPRTRTALKKPVMIMERVPDEILLSISELFDVGPTLISLSLVCKRFRATCIPILFRSIKVKDTRRLMELSHLCSVNPSLAQHIRHFVLYAGGWLSYGKVHDRRALAHIARTVGLHLKSFTYVASDGERPFPRNLPNLDIFKEFLLFFRNVEKLSLALEYADFPYDWDMYYDDNEFRDEECLQIILSHCVAVKNLDIGLPKPVSSELVSYNGIDVSVPSHVQRFRFRHGLCYVARLESWLAGLRFTDELSIESLCYTRLDVEALPMIFSKCAKTLRSLELGVIGLPSFYDKDYGMWQDTILRVISMCKGLSHLILNTVVYPNSALLRNLPPGLKVLDIRGTSARVSSRDYYIRNPSMYEAFCSDLAGYVEANKHILEQVHIRHVFAGTDLDEGMRMFLAKTCRGGAGSCSFGRW